LGVETWYREPRLRIFAGIALPLLALSYSDPIACGLTADSSEDLFGVNPFLGQFVYRVSYSNRCAAAGQSFYVGIFNGIA
jgi:hypothetical protein